MIRYNNIRRQIIILLCTKVPTSDSINICDNIIDANNIVHIASCYYHNIIMSVKPTRRTGNATAATCRSAPAIAYNIVYVGIVV